MKDKNTPEIRFKGFRENWQQYKLKDIGNTFTGLSGKTKEDFGHGSGRFITYMNVYTNPIATIKGTEPIEIDKKQNEVKYGDIFFTTSSETPEEVGMSSVWLENMPNTYLNSFCFGYRLNMKNDPYYMAYMLRSQNFRKKMILLAQGISRFNISKNLALEIEVNIPNNTEQRKIGETLHNIDNIIFLYQQKYDKLINIKKSMLEKMIPKHNEINPEIRFKKFTGNWKKSKISEMFIITRGYVLATSLTSSTKTDDMSYPVYSSQTKEDGLMGYYKDFLYENAITWTTDGANAGTVNYRSGKFYCTNVCGVLLSANIKANKIIAETLNKIAKNYVTYVGNPKLMNNVMANIEIKISPQEEEREYLSQFFTLLDKLIALYSCRINKLTNIKKSLIDKMFI